MDIINQRKAPEHKCIPPGVIHQILIDNGGPYFYEGTMWRKGELWKCYPCSRLWRLGLRCDWCEHYGTYNHRGQCVVGLEWRPASFWQKFLYRNR